MRPLRTVVASGLGAETAPGPLSAEGRNERFIHRGKQHYRPAKLSEPAASLKDVA